MGSTGLKAVAFEAGSGATLAAAGGALPYRQLPQGGCELAADAIASALAHAPVSYTHLTLPTILLV